MDQFTRRIIGFGIHAGTVDGVALCRMFNQAIRKRSVPKYLSSDHDPLFRFDQWQANLRILEVEEIKTVPYAPLSHPFVERLIGTLRREFLGPHLVLDECRSRRQAARIPELLQRLRTHTSLEAERPTTTRAYHGRSRISARTDGNPTARASIRHRCCLIFQRLSLAVTCAGLIRATSRNDSTLRFVTRVY